MVPDIVDFQGPEGLVRMVERFSLIDPKYYDRLKSVVSYGIPNHFVKIEASLHAPNQNSTEEELAAFFAATNTTGITEQVYILGSLFTKQMWDFYFDQLGTISDLQGSHDTVRKEAVHAWFEPDGRLETASPHQGLTQRQRFMVGAQCNFHTTANPYSLNFGC